MLLVSWMFVTAAILLLALNVVWAVMGASQIHLVPLLFWYIAVALRDEGMFMTSRPAELGLVLVLHVVLSVAAPPIARRILGRGTP
jgi:hypothetical protein